MAKKPQVGNPVQMEARTTTRKISLPRWATYQTAHWKGMTTHQKNKNNITTQAKRPIGSLFIFPSQDPYTALQRMEFRAVHENVSWINRALKIMKSTVTGWGYTASAEPRDEDEQIPDDEMDNWKENTRFSIPWAQEEVIVAENGEQSGGWTVAEIEKFVYNLSIKLDLQSHVSRCYLYTMEQGQCGILLLPEWKFTEDGTAVEDSTEEKPAHFMMPKVLRTLRPEHVVKIWLNMDTGEMSSLQIIGLSSRGGKMPVERLIWFTSDYNLEFNSDYYGISRILPLLDTGKVMVILYGKDFTEAAQYTWHQPRIFQVTIPTRDYKKVSEVLRKFLSKANNSAGRDIAVTQSVEPIVTNSNSGDITGLISMDDHLIDQVAGFFNIPPFLLSKGKAGNLGGNAQLEEIDAFLNVEVRPQQEILESFIEKQFYDRILQALFQEENIEKIPIKLVHNMVRPDIRTIFDKDQYEILLDLLQKNVISMDKFLERMNLVDAKKDDLTVSRGEDTTPGKNIFPRRNSRKKNPHWSGHGKWTKDEINFLKSEAFQKSPSWMSRPEIKIDSKNKFV